jgi:hypothetical protein
VQERVTVPDPTKLVGFSEPHVSPEGTASVIVIVPAKPFTAVSEIVATDEDPGATAEGEVALRRKSWKLNIATVM